MVSCKPQHFLLALSFCWLTTCIHVTSEKHSLKPGEKLNSTTLLRSQKGYYYVMKIQTSYLIIYANKNENWTVWVGNRNQPVHKDASLLLNHSGVLKIESNNTEPIILYASPQPSENTVATLLDTGNFVLQQLHSNGTNTTLWQSFDYPTDTLIPGMKLGVNHRSCHKWSLVSWLTIFQPSLGAFELEWEPTKSKLIIKRRGKLCWASGNLGNGRLMHDTYYEIVSNENESYFSITTFNEEHTIWTLFETGQLINRNGVDNINVARADLCYGYNTDEGFQRWEEIPLCRHPGDAFDSREGYPNEAMSNNLENSSYGLSDCQDMCWRNCSCAGFKSYYVDGTGCVFYHKNFTTGTNFASGGIKFFVLLNKPHHKGKKMWIWITVVSVLAALLVICAITLAIKKKKTSS